MTLICVIVSRIIVSEAYSLYYLRVESQFGVWIPLGSAEWCTQFWETLTLTFDLISRCSVSGAYLLYNISLS